MQKMQVMQTMCRLEWDQLSKRVSGLLSSDLSQRVASGKNSLTWEKKKQLEEYDRFMLQISNVNNILRKLNIYLMCAESLDMEMSSTTGPQTFADFSEKQFISLIPKSLMDSAEESVVKNVGNLDRARSMVEKNPRLMAYITHIENCADLRFYICQKTDYQTIVKISKCKDLEPIEVSVSFNKLLNNMIFGVSDFIECGSERCFNSEQSKFIWRGQFLEKNEGMNSLDQCKIMLIDSGKIVEATNKTRFYSLPMEYRKLSPMAFYCTLQGLLLNESDNLENCLKATPEFLCSCLNHEVQLYVTSVTTAEESANDIDIAMLHVYMYTNTPNEKGVKHIFYTDFKNIYQDMNQKKDESVKPNLLSMSAGNEQNKQSDQKAQITQIAHFAQKTQIVPIEKKQIYDKNYKEQNDMFKDNYDRSNDRNDEGIEIIKIENNLNNNLTTCMKIGSVFTVTITHIEEMWEFYGYNIDQEIPNDLPKLNWNHDEVADLLFTSKQVGKFTVGEIVLALYAKDAHWYRGRIIEVLQEQRQYKVRVLFLFNIYVNTLLIKWYLFAGPLY